MADLSFNEKMYIENILGMSTGHVLDFSNNKFGEFIYSILSVDVYKKYEYESKAKLMRRIFNDFNNREVGKLILTLLEYKKNHLSIQDTEKENFLKVVEIGNRLIGKTIPKVKSENKSKLKKQSFNFESSFDKLCELTKIDNSQERGYSFEKFLKNIFEENGLEPRGSYKITGEQIDGSFMFMNEVYLIEAKWTKNKVSKSDLVGFNDKVTSKSGFTRGLFISYSGFTDEALQTFGIGRKVNIILMTVEELAIILERRIDFKEIFMKKMRILAEEGNYFKSIRDIV